MRSSAANSQSLLRSSAANSLLLYCLWRIPVFHLPWLAVSRPTNSHRVSRISLVAPFILPVSLAAPCLASFSSRSVSCISPVVLFISPLSSSSRLSPLPLASLLFLSPLSSSSLFNLHCHPLPHGPCFVYSFRQLPIPVIHHICRVPPPP